MKKLDWNTYHKYIDKLADTILNNSHEGEVILNDYKYIAGIDPDDAIVAVHLSHRLNIPVISNTDMLSFVSHIIDTDKLLVVSNVVETGEKFKMVQTQVIGHACDTAAIFVDKNALWTPTYYVEKPKSYIYFPWQTCGIDVED